MTKIKGKGCISRHLIPWRINFCVYEGHLQFSWDKNCHIFICGILSMNFKRYMYIWALIPIYMYKNFHGFSRPPELYTICYKVVNWSKINSCFKILFSLGNHWQNSFRRDKNARVEWPESSEGALWFHPERSSGWS